MKLVTLQKMGVYFTLALIFITAVILLYIIINPFNLGPKPLQLLTIDELLGYNSSNPGKLIGVTVVNINEDAPNFYTYKVASADSTEYYVTSGYHYS
ncbi:MAG TPA: hypothetical protein DEA87_00390, partial [Candidatus Veblenbacteria bacterium]|nr:hypothetical protein [Candidatus Veblenbacteria bacterium]